ncbi:hypothetical protein CSKR_108726 [Clonorchis sinensis]|uniref:Uncharacterized protein n=1 Tax=Clonorchis sinensis TaxID=79923 RepID=A0A419PUB4_CLOSI|nr:hypothetical protein CSKR_108726 [Clonorchis sinensis]
MDLMNTDCSMESCLPVSLTIGELSSGVPIQGSGSCRPESLCRNTVICKSVWFCERLTWNPAESPVFDEWCITYVLDYLFCGVYRNLRQLFQTVSHKGTYQKLK